MEYHESDRLADVRATDLLDTPEEDRFDVITAAAARIFDVPIALVTLVDKDRQWFKSCLGLDVRETPRSMSFCSRAIETADAMVVPDATKDPRFVDNALVTGPPHIRFYAGHPVVGPNGYRIGTLCVIDTEPREFTDRDVAILADLAQWVQREMDAHNVAEIAEDLFDQQQTAAHLHQVIDALPDHVAILDDRGRILAINRAWAKFAAANGGDGDAYLGSDYLAVSRQSRDPPGSEVADMLEDVLGGVKGSFQVEYPCHAPNEERWFILRAVRIEGPPIEVLVTHTDITERVVAERSRQQAEREKTRMLRMKEESATRQQILNVISHQINTPLTPMRLHISTMRQKWPDASKHLDAMHRNVDRLETMSRTIHRAVQVASLRELGIEPVRWDHFWRHTAEALAHEHGIEERVRIDVSGDAIVSLDETWCHRMLGELLQNAARYAPAGDIVVEAHLDGSARLTVRDHGSGIQTSDPSHLFDAFSRSDDVVTDSGPGLGLFIVDRIARLHGGSVRYEEADPGSRFTVRFPRRAVVTETTTPSSQ